MTPPEPKKPKGPPRLTCNGTDGLLGASTRAADVANLEKALAKKPMKPPKRAR